MISADRLKELLIYEPDTGLFRWKNPAGRWGRIPAGTIAGTSMVNGYIAIYVGDGYYLAHRLAWLYMTGDWPPQDMDHIDRNPANNRFANLRPATRSQNNANRLAHKHSLTGIRGVHFDKRCGRYTVRIRKDGAVVWLGSFATPEEASTAYNNAAVALYGEYAAISARIAMLPVLVP